MNCKNCGTVLQPGTTICPSCNTPVQNPTVAPVQPELNGQAVATPVQPTQPVQPVETVAQPVENQVESTTSVVDTNVEQPTNPVEQVNSTIDNPSSETPVAVSTPNEQVSPVDAQPLNYGQTTITPEALASINPDGSSVNGNLVGNVAPIEPTKPKNKKKIMIISIIAIVLILLIGGGVLFYMYEYKSADKRIEAIYNYLTTFTENVKNDSVELKSGSYELNASVSYEDQTYSTNISGKYGIDLANKIIDYTVNINKLNMGEDLIDETLGLDLYLNDNKIYVLLENFYDKYIYQEVENVDQIFDLVEQNDINYVTLTRGIKVAIANGLKAMNATQSIEDVKIDGESKKVNVVRITMTARNEELFTKAFVNSLKSNSSFVSELAKLSGMSEDDVKTKLTESIQDVEYEGMEELKLELYSSLFGADYLGLKAILSNEGSKVVLESLPITDGTRFNLSVAGQKMLELDVKTTEKKNSTTVDSTVTIEGTVLLDSAIKFNVELKQSDDVNPKVDKVNVKNSINVQNLTEEDYNTIVSKIKEFGTLGILIAPYLETSNTDPSMNYDDTEYDFGDTTTTDNDFSSITN